MTRQTILRGVLVLLLLLIPASLAFGNSGSPALFFPGLVAFSPLLGLPATLVAAVLERPFVSRAGIQTHALTRSIRANVLSWLVGLFFVFLLGSNQVAVMLAILYFILAIPISILIEGGYYWAILKRRGGGLRWRWVIAANVISSVCLVALDFVPSILQEKYPRLEFVVEPNRPTLYWILAIISVALVAFALRPLGKGQRVVPEASEHGPGFECDATEQSMTHAADT
jgi:hypothetical protein